PYTQRLLNSGLVTPIVPDDSILGSGIDDYFTPFMALVDAYEPEIRRTPRAEWQMMRIHVDKTGRRLADKLADPGLPERPVGEDSDSWFVIERIPGHLLMSFLAGALGASPRNRIVPIPDSATCLRLYAGTPIAGPGDQEQRALIRDALLKNILPTPTTRIPP